MRFSNGVEPRLPALSVCKGHWEGEILCQAKAQEPEPHPPTLRPVRAPPPRAQQILVLKAVAEQVSKWLTRGIRSPGRGTVTGTPALVSGVIHQLRHADLWTWDTQAVAQDRLIFRGFIFLLYKTGSPTCGERRTLSAKHPQPPAPSSCLERVSLSSRLGPLGLRSPPQPLAPARCLRARNAAPGRGSLQHWGLRGQSLSSLRKSVVTGYLLLLFMPFMCIYYKTCKSMVSVGKTLRPQNASFHARPLTNKPRLPCTLFFEGRRCGQRGL